MDFTEPIELGRSGLKVGRLGVAASYGAGSDAFEEAFERGCNYFYWGSMRKKGMRDAIRNICGQGKRDQLVIVIQSYSRSALLMEVFLKRALKALRIERADVLLLGWHNKIPGKRVLDKALELKGDGFCRCLALSGHNRSLFPELVKKGVFDLFHFRYNAAHRGAEKDIFPCLQGTSVPGMVSYTATRWAQLLKARNMPPGESAPAASDCYRFVLSNPHVDVCISGPKNRPEMKEALMTLERGPLHPDEMARMERIGDHVHARGGKFF